MEKNNKDRETLYIMYRESAEDVLGWKILIFLPYNFQWRLIILVTVVFTFYMRTLEFFFDLTFEVYEYLELMCTCFYAIDAILLTIHFLTKRVSRLRYLKQRPIFLLVIDYISLLPFQEISTLFIFGERTKAVLSDFRLNVCLRIYQIFTFFLYESKYWMSKTSVYFLIINIQVMMSFMLTTHIYSCIFYSCFTKEARAKCAEKSWLCITEMEVFILSALSQNYFKTTMFDPLSQSWVFLVFCYVSGYILSYGCFFPFLYVAIYNDMEGRFDILNKIKHLQLSIKNLTSTKELREKLKTFLHLISVSGKGSQPPEIINFLPPSLKKNIYCDLNWEALRHSDFLSDLSMGCKRSLCLRMVVDYFLPNTNLINLNERKTYFYYIESGKVQIMAEENKSSPVITFSGGTVLGETSCFYQTKSKVIVRIAKLAMIHSLSFKDFLFVMLDYPQDMKKLQKKLKYRLNLAKTTHLRKTKICPNFSDDYMKYNVKNFYEKGNIKWIKKQFRALLDLKTGYEKLQQGKHNIRPYIQELKTQLDHTSLNMSLISVNDEIINKYEVVCLKARFPWFMDPQSTAIRVWNIFIICLCLAVCLIYPVFIAWYPSLSVDFLNFAMVVSIAFITDVFIRLCTAVKIQNTFVTQLGSIISLRFGDPSFYLDVIAALPVQIPVYFGKGFKEPFKNGILFVLPMFKSYKIFIICTKIRSKSYFHPALQCFSKYTFMFLLVIYWIGALFKLTGVNCLFYFCGDDDWYKRLINDTKENHKEIFISVYVVALVAVNIPSIFSTSNLYSLVLYFCVFFMFRIYSLILISSCVCSYAFDKKPKVLYKKLMDVVMYFAESRKIEGRLVNRIMDTLAFYWYYDRGNYITEETQISKVLTKHLREEIDRDTLYRTLEACPLFKIEDEDFIMSICRKSHRLALPNNSVLLTFGTRTLTLCLIHKGFVNLNSFLAEDIVRNIGKPIFLGKGEIFPVIIAFNQLPSVLTGCTLTDCELIYLRMEDVLATAMVHDTLKDTVDALKETGITKLFHARPGFSIITQRVPFDKMAYMSPFLQLKPKFLGLLLSHIFIKKGINPNGKVYMVWEIIHISCILLGLLMWPFVFGCLTQVNKIVFIYCLIVIDSTGWIDFIMRLNLAFYNKNGLYIDHPLATHQNYLTSSFIMDLLAFIPYLHIIFLPLNNINNYSLFVILVHLGLRLLALYRLFGIVVYFNSITRFTFKLDYITLFVTILLLVNIIVNIKLYLYFHNEKSIHALFRNESTVFDVYQNEALLIVDIIIGNKFTFGKIKLLVIIQLLVLVFIGWTLMIFQLAFYQLQYISMGNRHSVYNYNLRSFIKFLKSENAERNIIDEVQEHYEHVWHETRAINYKSIFSKFPDILQEDILYANYKSVLKEVSCLSNANETFYRTISRNLEEEHLEKGATIMLQNQVLANIFFIQTGKCFVEKKNVVLEKGSMMGDIKRNGLIRNTILAKTHVKLLKMSSKMFYLILSDYSSTKKSFEEDIAKYEDFVKSDYSTIDGEIEKKKVVKVKENVEMESKFEEYKLQASESKGRIEAPKLKERMSRVLEPESRLFRFFKKLFLLDALITIFFLPTAIGTRSEIPLILTCIYILDLIWILKIIVTLKMAILNPKTGNYIFHKKTILKTYLRRFDGLIIDILSILPIEIGIYISNAVYRVDNQYTLLFYSLRVLRFFYLSHYSSEKENRLSVNKITLWWLILLKQIFILNAYVCINMFFASEKRVTLLKSYRNFDSQQWRAYINSYICTVNVFIGADIPMCDPDSNIEMIYDFVVGLTGFFFTAHFFMKTVIFYHGQFSQKIFLMRELHQLENFLEVRGLSSALLKKTKTYITDLIDYSKEGAMPTFLTYAPDFIKFRVMGDLYVHHIEKCYLFEGLNQVFLLQLVSRLEKFTYFPGDYITEKGDVDYSIYFLHDGEVLILDNDKYFQDLERPVGSLLKNEHFGTLQGIFPRYPHEHTYRAKTLVQILVLNFKGWEDVRLAYPDLTKQIYDRATRRRMFSGKLKN